MKDVTHQILEGNGQSLALCSKVLLMQEINESRKTLKKLEYGVSVTDACIDWETTEQSLIKMAEKLKDVLPNRLRRLKT
ncbi:MAG: hypothetical protein Ct9H300mP22_7680 [Gammaproteobacteria bacterium]|nr:MAG: hypothetical protein Ct9H300mP22_7680 [Gammaproteobacteria bacterium]